MKYKYKYKTNSGSVEIEVNKKWSNILAELDRLERNCNRRETEKHISYNAFEYVPDFMGRDEEAEKRFESPAYDYAMSHLTPIGRDIFKRRLIRGERNKDIAAYYNMDDTNCCKIYKYAYKKFKHFYAEGEWLASYGQKYGVKAIPFGLTPEKVLQILELRRECKSYREIAAILGVTSNSVKSCISKNPVYETKCFYCGKVIKQRFNQSMVKFCSNSCYLHWFHKNAFKNGENKKLSNAQKVAIDYYRKNFYSIPKIRSIIGKSEQIIAAYCEVNPIPYTVCKKCGKKIPGDIKHKPLKFCDIKCANKYHDYLKKLKKAHRYIPEPTLCFPDQIYLVVDMREGGYTHEEIAYYTNMTRDRVRSILEFVPPFNRQCRLCNKEFSTRNIKQFFCSTECHNKRWKVKKRRIMKEPFTKVVTPIVRIINAHIWEPILIDNIPLYTATILIPKSDEKFISTINEAVKNAIIEGGIKYGKRRYDLRRHKYLPLKDGDLLDNPLFKDCYYINASRTSSPIIYDRSVLPLTDPAAVVSGDSVRVSLTFKPFTNDNNNGVHCKLGNFQKVYVKHEPITSEDTLFEEFKPAFLLANDCDNTQE